MADLFDKSGSAPVPLADRMRPATLEEFLGQEDVIGPGKPLTILLETGAVLDVGGGPWV